TGVQTCALPISTADATTASRPTTSAATGGRSGARVTALPSSGPPRAHALPYRPSAASLDDLPAHQELRHGGGADEARQGDHQRGLEVELRARADAQQDDRQQAVHV